MTQAKYNKIKASKGKLIAERFIEALNKDIASGRHATQVNHQVLWPAIHLLENRHLHPQLSLADIVRGALNMTLSLQDTEYKLLSEEIIGKEKFDGYVAQSKRWFGDYAQQIGLAYKKIYEFNSRENILKLNDVAFPVIERASKGPLYLMTGCVQETLSLYFEYVKQVDPSIKEPNLPLSPLPNNFSLRGLEVFIPEIPEFQDEPNVDERIEILRAEKERAQKEEEFLNNMLNEFSAKISFLEETTYEHEKSLETARILEISLSAAIKGYQNDKDKIKFVDACAGAISRAKPKLEKELGLGQYLTNWLIAIANFMRSAANTLTRSNFGLFTPEKAPIVAEVEGIEKGLKDLSNLSPY